MAGAVLPRPIRRPVRRAAITLLSLTTKQSPGRSRSGKSPMMWSTSSSGSPGLMTKSRAASRGTAGRSAIRSEGSLKSKRSVFMPSYVMPGLVPASIIFCLACSKTWMAGTSPAMTQYGPIRLRPHRRFDDPVGVLHRFAALDLIDVFHAFDHLAPDRVLVVEKPRVVEADEKLTVARIRIAGSRHRYGTSYVRLAIEFGLELFS